MTNKIITIGRQYGSGGREIGEKLAEKLGFHYYDTLLLEKAAQKGRLTETIMERYDEQLADKWLSLSMASSVFPAGRAEDMSNLPVPLRAIIAQFEVIRQIGLQESAVIVGRCADYVLREQKNVLSVFIHADMEQRIQRVSKRNKIGVEEAEKRIRNTDKHRAAYYNYYTNKKWGMTASYDLCIDSSHFGMEGAVEILQNAVKLS